VCQLAVIEIASGGLLLKLTQFYLSKTY